MQQPRSRPDKLQANRRRSPDHVGLSRSRRPSALDWASALGNSTVQKIMRAPIPPGPRQKNPPLDKYEFMKHLFRPKIFWEFAKGKGVFLPLKRLINAYEVENQGNAGGIRLKGGDAQAIERLIDKLCSPSEKAIIREGTKGSRREEGLIETFFILYRKEAKLANAKAQREYRKSDFRFFHEWAALHYELEKTDRYQKKGKKWEEYHVGGKRWKTEY